ncbi:MAG: UDP-N-acetylmuramoyl-L-alanine--D-glutamate ligase, partial [Candidatus Moranbacteria bacterium]|nr:UDP-N-acetylmuramoyl-L-alanine--D-glutamate ligase [Candidatus Moranbacteria bacterium]
SSKKLDPASFLKKIVRSKYVKNIFILDSPLAKKIQADIIELGGGDKIRGIYSDFNESIKSAYSETEKGELVLLSPGFASFGMFENEFERGRQFRKIVNNLK